MDPAASTPPVAADGSRRAHIAARFEDRIHAFRERRGRRRGLVPTVIPFPGYGGDGWVRVLCRVVLAKPGLRAPDRYTSIRGWRSFLSIPVRDAEIQVTAGGVAHTIRSDRGGVVDARVEARLDAGWAQIELRVDEAEPLVAPVFVVGDDVRLGLVSDVDDTVVVTALPRPLLAGWNTFVVNEHARRPVPGMAVLYDRLIAANPGIPIVYLSTGPWNIVRTLDRFLSRNLYPRGAFLLTDWGPTHERWFRSGQQHKAANLLRLAVEFPDVRWLLVGDDGQHDEERYAEFAAAHPDSVAAVAIRRLTPGEAVFAGGRSGREEHERSTPWVYGSDGAEIAEQLASLGLLGEPRA